MGGLRIAALAFAVVSVALSSFASASTDDIVATRAFFVSESQYNDAGVTWSSEATGLLRTESCVDSVQCSGVDKLTVWVFERPANLTAMTLKSSSVSSAKIRVGFSSPTLEANLPVTVSLLEYPDGAADSQVCLAHPKNYCYWPAMYKVEDCPAVQRCSVPGTEIGDCPPDGLIPKTSECTGELVASAEPATIAYGPELDATPEFPNGYAILEVDITSMFGAWVDFENDPVRKYFILRVDTSKDAEFDGITTIDPPVVYHSPTIVWDLETIPPTVSSITPDDTSLRTASGTDDLYTSSSSVKVQITFSEDVIQSSIAIDPVPTSLTQGTTRKEYIAVFSGITTTFTITVSNAKDYANNVQTTSYEAKVIYDVTPPTVSFFPEASEPAKTFGQSTDWTLTFDDEIAVQDFLGSIKIELVPEADPEPGVPELHVDNIILSAKQPTDDYLKFELHIDIEPGHKDRQFKLILNPTGGSQLIADRAGNLLAVDTEVNYVIDSVSPKFVSFSRQTCDIDPTHLSSACEFKLTFDKPVFNVNAAVIAIDDTPTTAEDSLTVLAVSSTGPATEWTFTVIAIGKGEADIYLDIAVLAANVVDTLGNPYSIGDDDGVATYTYDTSTPNVQSTDAPEPTVFVRTIDPVTVTFNKVVSEFTTKVSGKHDDTTDANIVISASPVLPAGPSDPSAVWTLTFALDNTYTVTDDAVEIKISGAVDLYGNVQIADHDFTLKYMIDREAPTVKTPADPVEFWTSAPPFVAIDDSEYFEIEFSEAVSVKSVAEDCLRWGRFPRLSSSKVDAQDETAGAATTFRFYPPTIDNLFDRRGGRAVQLRKNDTVCEILDVAGNMWDEEFSAMVTFDRQGPVIDFETDFCLDRVISAKPTITMDISDITQDTFSASLYITYEAVDEDDVAVKVVTCSGDQPPLVFNDFTVADTHDGNTVLLTVKGEDNGGHAFSTTCSVKVDTSAPSLDENNSDPPSSDPLRRVKPTPCHTTAYCVYLTAVFTTDDVDDSIPAVGKITGKLSTIPDGGAATTPSDCTVGPFTDGRLSIECVVGAGWDSVINGETAVKLWGIADKVGNAVPEETPLEFSFYIDTVAPIPDVLPVGGNMKEGDIITLTFSETIDALTPTEVKFTFATTAVGGWAIPPVDDIPVDAAGIEKDLNYNGVGEQWTVRVPALSHQGLWDLVVTATDAADNAAMGEPTVVERYTFFSERGPFVSIFPEVSTDLATACVGLTKTVGSIDSYFGLPEISEITEPIDSNDLVTYSGFIYIPVDGDYVFAISTVGDASLTIGGADLISFSGTLDSTERTKTAEAKLDVGLVSFELTRGGQAPSTFSLAWLRPDMVYEVIGVEHFRVREFCVVSSNPTFQAIFSSAVTTDTGASLSTLEWVSATNDATGTIDAVLSNSITFSFTFADGLFTLQTMATSKVKDAVGNALVATATFDFVVDGIAPTCTLDPETGQTSRQDTKIFTVTGSCSEPLLLVFDAETPTLAVEITTTLTGNKKEFVIEVDATAVSADTFGVSIILPVVTDLHGNGVDFAEVSPYMHTIDNELDVPTVVITSEYPDNVCQPSSFNITYTFAETIAKASIADSADGDSGLCTQGEPSIADNVVTVSVFCPEPFDQDFVSGNAAFEDVYTNQRTVPAITVNVDADVPIVSVTPATADFGDSFTWEWTLSEEVTPAPSFFVRTSPDQGSDEAYCALDISVPGMITVTKCAEPQEVWVHVDGVLSTDCAGNAIGYQTFGPYHADPTAPTVSITPGAAKPTWDGSAWDPETSNMDAVFGKSTELTLTYSASVSGVATGNLICNVEGSDQVTPDCTDCGSAGDSFTFAVTLPSGLNKALVACTANTANVKNSNTNVAQAEEAIFIGRALTTDVTAQFTTISPSYNTQLLGANLQIGTSAKFSIKFSHPVKLPASKVTSFLTLVNDIAPALSVTTITAASGTETDYHDTNGYFVDWEFSASTTAVTPSDSGPDNHPSTATLHAEVAGCSEVTGCFLADPAGNHLTTTNVTTTVTVDIKRPSFNLPTVKKPGKLFSLTATTLENEPVLIPSISAVSYTVKAPGNCKLGAPTVFPPLDGVTYHTSYMFTFASTDDSVDEECTLIMSFNNSLIHDHNGNSPHPVNGGTFSIPVDLKSPIINTAKLSPATATPVPQSFQVFIYTSESLATAGTKAFAAPDVVMSGAAGCSAENFGRYTSPAPVHYRLDVVCESAGRLDLTIAANAFEDLFDNALRQDYSWYYMVDIVAPTVKLVELSHPEVRVWPFDAASSSNNAQLLFSEAIKSTDVQDANFVWTTGAGVTYVDVTRSQSYDSATQVVTAFPGLISKTNEFIGSTGEVKLTISGVKDIAGNEINPAQEFIWPTDFDAPSVTRVELIAPHAADDHVVPHEFLVRVTFSEPVNMATKSAATYLSVSATITPDITFDTDFAPMSTETATVTNGRSLYTAWEVKAESGTDNTQAVFTFATNVGSIADGSNNPLVTSPTSVSSIEYRIDSQAPVIQTSNPASASTIPRATNFIYVFDEEVVGLSVDDLSVLQSGVPVSGVTKILSGVDRIWVFHVSFPAGFEDESIVDVVLTDASDKWGNKRSETDVAEHTISGVKVSTKVPSATLSPAGPVKGVVDYTLHFSEAVTGVTVNSLHVTLPTNAGSITCTISNFISVSPTEYTFQITYKTNGGALTAPAVVSVDGGAMNAAGNLHPGQSFSSFVDFQAPTVTYPTSLYMSAASAVVFTFSEAVVPATVVVDVEYLSGPVTIKITPSAGNTVFTAAVTFPGTDDNVDAHFTLAASAADLAGNTLAAPVTFTKTITRNAPRVVSFLPAAPVTGSCVDNVCTLGRAATVKVTFSKTVSVSAEHISVNSQEAFISDLTPLGDSSSWEFKVLFFKEGSVSVRISTCVTDSAGQYLEVTDTENELTVAVDLSGPTVVQVTPTPYITLGKDFEVVAKFSENIITGAAPTIQFGTATPVTGSCVGDVCTFTVTNVAHGSHSVYIRAASDVYENPMQLFTTGFTIDATEPALVSVQHDIVIGAVATFSFTFDEDIVITADGSLPAATLTWPGLNAGAGVLSNSNTVAFEVTDITTELLITDYTLSGVRDVYGNVITDLTQALPVAPTVDLTAPTIDGWSVENNAFVSATGIFRVQVSFSDTTFTSSAQPSLTTSGTAKAVYYSPGSHAIGIELSGFDNNDEITLSISGAVDMYGNSITDSSVAFTIDNQAPTATLAVFDIEVYSGFTFVTVAKPKFTATVDEATTSELSFLSVSYAGGKANAAGQTADGNNWEYTLGSNLPEGAVTATLAGLYDHASNQIAAVQTTFVVDTVAPTYTIIPPALTVGHGDVTVTLRVSEPVRLVDQTVISGASSGYVISGGVVELSSTEYTVTLNGLPDGTLELLFTLQDYAGHAATPSALMPTITIDAIAPTVEVVPASGTFQGLPKFAVRVSFSEAVTIPVGAITAKQGVVTRTFVLARVQGTNDYDVTISGLATGELVLEVSTDVTDLYGNAIATVQTNTYTIDQDYPIITSVAVEGLIGSTYVNSQPITVMITFQDSNVMISNENVVIHQLGNAPVIGTVNLTDTVATATFTGLAQGVATIEVAGVTDTLNNQLPRAFYTGFTVDTAAPEASITSPAAGSTTGYVSTFTVSFTETPTAFASANVKLNHGIAVVTATSNPRVFTVKVDNTGDLDIVTGDALTVEIIAVKDAAQNDLTAFYPVSFIYDVAPATVTAASPASGKVRLIGETLVVDLTFSEDVQTFDASAFSLSGAASATATLSVKRGTAQHYTLVFSGLVDGALNVAVSPSGQVKDLFNNPSAEYSLSYILDSTSPVIADKEVVPAAVNTVYLNSHSLILTVTFSEALANLDPANVNFMQSSSEQPAATVDVQSPTVFVVTSPTLADGELTITFSGLTDSVGNTFGGAAFNYIIDTDAPTFTTSPTAESLPALGTTGTIVFTFSEPLSSFDQHTNFHYTPADATIESVTRNTLARSDIVTVKFSGLTTDLTVGFTDLVDRASNALATGDVAFFVDTVAPTLTDVTPAPLSKDPAAVYPGSMQIRLTVSEALGAAPKADITVSDAGAKVLFYRDTALPNEYVLEVSSLSTGDVSIVISASQQWMDLSANAMAPQILQYAIDATAPASTGIAPTPNTAVSYIRPGDSMTVAFSEAITGVAASNLRFAQDGHGFLYAQSVTGSDSSYTFVVPADIVNGYVTVSIISGNAKDAAGNALAASSWTYRVSLSNGGATISPASGSIIASSFNASITFSVAPTSFAAANVVLSQTQAKVSDIVQDALNSLKFHLTISGLNQTVSDSLAVSFIDLVDDAANPFTCSWTFVVDTAAPVMVSTSPASGALIAGGFVTFTVNFDERIQTPSVASLSVSQTGATPSVLSAPVTDTEDSSAWTWRVSNVGNGPLALTISPAGAPIRDVLNNALAPTVITLVVDTIAPTVTVALFADKPVFETQVIHNITFSEAVTGMDLSDLVSSQGIMRLNTIGIGASTIYSVTLFNLKPGPVSLGFTDSHDVVDAVGNRLAAVSWSYHVITPSTSAASLHLTPIVECFFIDEATGTRIAHLGYESQEGANVAVLQGDFNSITGSDDKPIEAFFNGRHVLAGSVNLNTVSSFGWRLAGSQITIDAAGMVAAKCPSTVTLLLSSADQPSATVLDAIRTALASIAGVPVSQFSINAGASGAAKKRAGYTVAVDTNGSNAAGTASSISNAPPSAINSAYASAGVPAGVSTDVQASNSGLGAVQGQAILVPVEEPTEDGAVTTLAPGGIAGIVIAFLVAGLVVGALIVFLVMRSRNNKNNNNNITPRSDNYKPEPQSKPEEHVDTAPAVAPVPVAAADKQKKTPKATQPDPPAPPARGRAPSRSVEQSSRSRSYSSHSRSPSRTPRSRSPSETRSDSRSPSGSLSSSRSRSPSRSDSETPRSSRSSSPSRSVSGEAKFDD